MKKLLIALFIAAPSILFAQAQGAPTIVTLEDALRLAEENAPSMRQSRNSVRSARMTLTQRYAAFLPTISTSASFRPEQNGGDANYTTGINASLNGLFNQNTYFAIATAKRGIETAEANGVTSKFQLRTQVKQQYFGILQAQEQLTAARNALRIADTNMVFIRARVGTGMSIESDSLGQLQTVLTARLAVQQAEHNITNQTRTFSRTLGIETQVQPDPRDTANFQIIPLDSAALIGMLRDSPAQVQQRASVATASNTLRNAKLAFIPTLTGGVSWGRSGSGVGMFGYGTGRYQYQTNEPNISFSISLPVFNAFNREGGLVSAREGMENAQLNYRDQQLTQENTLLNLMATIRFTVIQMENQRLQIQIAERNLQVSNTRYDQGLETAVQVLNNQNSLFNAQNNVIATRNTYRNQIAQLEQLVGRELR